MEVTEWLIESHAKEAGTKSPELWRKWIDQHAKRESVYSVQDELAIQRVQILLRRSSEFDVATVERWVQSDTQADWTTRHVEVPDDSPLIDLWQSTLTEADGRPKSIWLSCDAHKRVSDNTRLSGWLDDHALTISIASRGPIRRAKQRCWAIAQRALADIGSEEVILIRDPESDLTWLNAESTEWDNGLPLDPGVILYDGIRGKQDGKEDDRTLSFAAWQRRLSDATDATGTITAKYQHRFLGLTEELSVIVRRSHPDDYRLEVEFVEASQFDPTIEFGDKAFVGSWQLTPI